MSLSVALGYFFDRIRISCTLLNGLLISSKIHIYIYLYHIFILLLFQEIILIKCTIEYLMKKLLHNYSNFHFKYALSAIVTHSIQHETIWIVLENKSLVAICDKLFINKSLTA